MKKTMKASDVFGQSYNPFVPKTSFEGAFPNIESIIVRVTEVDDYGDETSRTYTNGNFGQYINCSKTNCYDGGFNIGDAVSTLYFRRQTEGQGQVDCQGHEGTPKGRRKGDRCDHTFRYTITIVYKSENKEDSKETNS